MKKLILIAILFVAACACTNNTGVTSSSNTDTTTVDTTVVDSVDTISK